MAPRKGLSAEALIKAIADDIRDNHQRRPGKTLAECYVDVVRHDWDAPFLKEAYGKADEEVTDVFLAVKKELGFRR